MDAWALKVQRFKGSKVIAMGKETHAVPERVPELWHQPSLETEIY